MIPLASTVSRLSLMLAIALSAVMVAFCQHPDFQEIQTVPLLISPKDNETVYDSVITFSWQHDTQGQDGLVYELWVDGEMVAEVEVEGEGGGQEYSESVKIPFKEKCQPINWLIRIRNDFQYSNSKTGFFNFVCIDPPVLISPEIGYCFQEPIENKLSNIELSWDHDFKNDPNIEYEVWINGTKIDSIHNISDQNIFTYLFNPLPSIDCMSFNWHIVAKNQFQTEKSTQRSFSLLYLKPVSLMYPEHQQTIACRENISFEWEGYACYDSYQLTIQNSNYQEEIFEVNTSGTTQFAGQLATEGTYTWMVKGIKDSNVIDVYNQRTLIIISCSCPLSRLTVEENEVFMTYPSLRSESAFIYDPIQNLFWLHGGYWWSYQKDPKQDTWKFDPKEWKWTDVSNDVDFPTSSDGHIIAQSHLKGAYDSKRQAFLVYHETVLSRLSLNPLGKWEIIFDLSKYPDIEKTTDHVIGYYEKADTIIVLPPSSNKCYLFKHDKTTNKWNLEQKPFIENNLYSAAHFIYYPKLDVFIYTLGMNDSVEDGLNKKTYLFNPNTETWSILETVGEQPSPRNEGSSVYEPCANKIFFISGNIDPSGYNSQTLLFNENIIYSLEIQNDIGVWERLIIPCENLSFPGGAQSSAISNDGLLINIDIKKTLISATFDKFFSYWRIE